MNSSILRQLGRHAPRVLSCRSGVGGLTRPGLSADHQLVHILQAARSFSADAKERTGPTGPAPRPDGKNPGPVQTAKLHGRLLRWLYKHEESEFVPLPTITGRRGGKGYYDPKNARRLLFLLTTLFFLLIEVTKFAASDYNRLRRETSMLEAYSRASDPNRPEAIAKALEQLNDNYFKTRWVNAWIIDLFTMILDKVPTDPQRLIFAPFTPLTVTTYLTSLGGIMLFGPKVYAYLGRARTVALFFASSLAAMVGSAAVHQTKLVDTREPHYYTPLAYDKDAEVREMAESVEVFSAESFRVQEAKSLARDIRVRLRKLAMGELEQPSRRSTSQQQEHQESQPVLATFWGGSTKPNTEARRGEAEHRRPKTIREAATLWSRVTGLDFSLIWPYYAEAKEMLKIEETGLEENPSIRLSSPSPTQIKKVLIPGNGLCHTPMGIYDVYSESQDDFLRPKLTFQGDYASPQDRFYGSYEPDPTTLDEIIDWDRILTLSTDAIGSIIMNHRTLISLGDVDSYRWWVKRQPPLLMRAIWAQEQELMRNPEYALGVYAQARADYDNGPTSRRVPATGGASGAAAALAAVSAVLFPKDRILNIPLRFLVPGLFVATAVGSFLTMPRKRAQTEPDSDPVFRHWLGTVTRNLQGVTEDAVRFANTAREMTAKKWVTPPDESTSSTTLDDVPAVQMGVDALEYQKALDGVLDAIFKNPAVQSVMKNKNKAATASAIESIYKREVAKLDPYLIEDFRPKEAWSFFYLSQQLRKVLPSEVQEKLKVADLQRLLAFAQIPPGRYVHDSYEGSVLVMILAALLALAWRRPTLSGRFIKNSTKHILTAKPAAPHMQLGRPFNGSGPAVRPPTTPSKPHK